MINRLKTILLILSIGFNIYLLTEVNRIMFFSCMYGANNSTESTINICKGFIE